MEDRANQQLLRNEDGLRLVERYGSERRNKLISRRHGAHGGEGTDFAFGFFEQKDAKNTKVGERIEAVALQRR